ncbi:uncharacterized protein TNCV_2575151 [Trichonephila clavipes]|nr:uncharacterized protein TNCV_2575151 [Trichonephila clavipes]
MPARNIDTGCHSPVSCYDCGNPGFIKSKCPKMLTKKESAFVNAIQMYTCLNSPVALLDIEVYEATSTVCADTDASQTSGIVMDMRNNFWYFGDKPSFRITLTKNVSLPVDDNPVEINSTFCATNSIPIEVPLQSNPVDETETNDLHLREEGRP